MNDFGNFSESECIMMPKFCEFDYTIFVLKKVAKMMIIQPNKLRNPLETISIGSRTITVFMYNNYSSKSSNFQNNFFFHSNFFKNFYLHFTFYI